MKESQNMSNEETNEKDSAEDQMPSNCGDWKVVYQGDGSASITLPRLRKDLASRMISCVTAAEQLLACTPTQRIYTTYATSTLISLIISFANSRLADGVLRIHVGSLVRVLTRMGHMKSSIPLLSVYLRLGTLRMIQRGLRKFKKYQEYVARNGVTGDFSIQCLFLILTCSVAYPSKNSLARTIYSNKFGTNTS